jgi:hypothetical protein
MLNKGTLAMQNAQPRRVNRPLLVLIGASSLVPAAVVFVLKSSLAFTLAVVLAAGARGCCWPTGRRRPR